MSMRTKVGWTVFLLWHMLVMAASIARDVPGVGYVRAFTVPYEQFLGVHQTWSMFSPNAPLTSEWLEAQGITKDGKEVPLHTFTNPPDEVHLIYNRMAKFERNVGKENKGKLRTDYARALCRWAGQDANLKAVRFTKHTRRTPPPERRAEVPRSEWKVEDRSYGARDCP